ncbi:flagellar brake protein [Blastococcus sp. SYSU DS0617]
MTDQDAGRPEESSRADVTLVARGVTVTACVDVSTEFTIVVRPDGEGVGWKTAVKDGDPVALYWIGENEERTLPAKIVEVEAGEEPRWHLAATGPAERSQRRKAVRGRVALPVYLPWADGQLVGETIDLSEAGVRVLVDGWGLPPEPGAHLEVSIALEDEVLHLKGEVVRQQSHGPRWLLSMSFQDVADRDANQLRRRVFQALREERALA